MRACVHACSRAHLTRRDALLTYDRCEAMRCDATSDQPDALLLPAIEPFACERHTTDADGRTRIASATRSMDTARPITTTAVATRRARLRRRTPWMDGWQADRWVDRARCDDATVDIN
jgi:hypothetical protein